MEPCQYIRLTVGNLAIKPQPKQQTHNIIHPTTSPYYCKIKLKGISFPMQSSPIPHIPSESSSSLTFPDSTPAATFHVRKSNIITRVNKKMQIKIYIYTGGTGGTCGLSSGGKELGKVSLPLGNLCRVVNNDGNNSNSNINSSKSVVLHNGWTRVGKCEFHFVVRVDPDPRFVFEFDGEPECSPQVFQVDGCNIRQPVFSCKFSFRHPSSHQRSRSFQWDQGSGRGWLSTLGSERERSGKERKGWSITVHDLSGSPVAAASMVTPFVASTGSDRVSRSNPGSWLILRPGEGTWRPWGRLEAWREKAGSSDGVGFKFELIADMSAANAVVLTESTLSTTKGGTFSIDLGSSFLGSGSGSGHLRSSQRVGSPGCSPRGVCSPRVGSRGSGDFGFGLWSYGACKGFVMAARVEGEGKCSKPTVEVSVQHVTCTEDAAAYVAVAAAVDLSIDACRLFSQKLRKELCQSNDLAF